MRRQCPPGRVLVESSLTALLETAIVKQSTSQLNSSERFVTLYCFSLCEKTSLVAFYVLLASVNGIVDRQSSSLLSSEVKLL